MNTYHLKVDWFTFTLKERSFNRPVLLDEEKGIYKDSFLSVHDQAVDTIENVLRMPSSLFVKSRPIQGVYLNSLSFGNIHIDYNPRETVTNTGVCVTMTGTGCNDFLAYSSWKSLPDFLVWVSSSSVYAVGFNCSRLDVAIDEHSPLGEDMLLDIRRIAHKVSSREFVSSTHVKSVFGTDVDVQIERSWRSSKAPEGITCYIGSLKSKLGFIRIYDKAVEQKITDEQITRLEMVLRNGYANDFIQLLANGVSFKCAAVSTLSDRLRFVDIDSWDTRHSSVCQWWSDFLLNVSKEETQPIRIKKPRKTLELQRLLNWISRQVASSLRTLGDCIGYEDLMKMIRTTRQSDRQLELIRQYKLSVA